MGGPRSGTVTTRNVQSRRLVHGIRQEQLWEGQGIREDHRQPGTLQDVRHTRRVHLYDEQEQRRGTLRTQAHLRKANHDADLNRSCPYNTWTFREPEDIGILEKMVLVATNGYRDGEVLHFMCEMPGIKASQSPQGGTLTFATNIH